MYCISSDDQVDVLRTTPTSVVCRTYYIDPNRYRSVYLLPSVERLCFIGPNGQVSVISLHSIDKYLYCRPTFPDGQVIVPPSLNRLVFTVHSLMNRSLSHLHLIVKYLLYIP